MGADMRVTNLILSIISSVVMLAADFLVLSITFVGSLIGVAVYSSSRADTDMINEFFGMFAASLAVGIIGLAVLILGIIAFAKGGGDHPSAKKYVVLSGIVCGITMIAVVCAGLIAAWVNTIVADTGFYYAWPVIQGVLLIVMVIMTILHTVKLSKRGKTA